MDMDTGRDDGGGAGVEARTRGGVVCGTVEEGVSVFRGIPYASLPERFGAPAPAQRWSGVREATRFGPPPPQPGGTEEGARAEDGEWLTANVWSPGTGGRLPVMVWIHGGAYTFGRADLPEYDGRTLALGGVVVVTFNYRVGLEGFGAVPGAPHNRGLLDQVALLEWVQANIAGLGGDPGSVTVFGQSAGGGSVAALLAMPRAAGLFHRAIVQSAQGTYFTPALAADIVRVLAGEVGVEPAMLHTVDPWLLPAAAEAVSTRIEGYAARWGRAAHAPALFAPVVDGESLPTTPWEGLNGGVDLLVGHTRHEQRLLSLISGDLGTVTREQAEEAVDVFAPDPAGYRSAFPDPEELYETVRSDWLFRMPSLWLVRAQLAAGGRAHVFELTWPAPGLDGVLGACHGLDVPLVFGNLAEGQTAMLIGAVTPEAIEVSSQLRTAWVAFATTGDPGWPGFQTGQVRVFDSPPT